MFTQNSPPPPPQLTGTEWPYRTSPPHHPHHLQLPHHPHHQHLQHNNVHLNHVLMTTVMSKEQALMTTATMMSMDTLEQPYPCAGCKLNWMTGTSKAHDCNFTDQYVSDMVRTDFQTALPRYLMWLVQVFSANAVHYSLMSIAMAIGVTRELLTKARSQLFKGVHEQANYVFQHWALDRLAEGVDETEVVINVVQDLCESGKTEFVLLLWSKDDFNFS